MAKKLLLNIFMALAVLLVGAHASVTVLTSQSECCYNYQEVQLEEASTNCCDYMSESDVLVLSSFGPDSNVLETKMVEEDPCTEVYTSSLPQTVQPDYHSNVLVSVEHKVDTKPTVTTMHQSSQSRFLDEVPSCDTTCAQESISVKILAFLQDCFTW
ncbi:MAG: hypothetical protein H6500_04730 [Candidatus Woesearchaeota archaeon]|nr:MAG: hypothetical protein H6500_04730 [Candidatus Woesearchaeota archaeon]